MPKFTALSKTIRGTYAELPTGEKAIVLTEKSARRMQREDVKVGMPVKTPTRDNYRETKDMTGGFWYSFCCGHPHPCGWCYCSVDLVKDCNCCSGDCCECCS